jgi:hypothetical protein
MPSISRACDTFAQSILNAQNLIMNFNTLNEKPPRPEIDVLKRRVDHGDDCLG